MHFKQEMDTLVLGTNALETLIRTSVAHTQLHVATSDFQTDLM